MVFEVTPLYALPVAAIYLVLWFRVSSLRSDAKVSFGDGGNAFLLQRMRQHGNCAEWSKEWARLRSGCTSRARCC